MSCSASTRTRNPAIRMNDRTFLSVLMLAMLLACAIGNAERARAQSAWTPTRPPQKLIASAAVTPEQTQVDARRPGFNQARAAAALSPKSEEIADSVALASYSEPLVGDEVYDGLTTTCDCPECNPISHLGCTIPGCGCGAVLRGRGVWVGAEYLLWSLQGMDVPELATSSPPGTSPANTGVLGLATTRTLVDGTLADGMRSGGRLRAGIWTDRTCQIAWEASYMALENAGDNFSFTSSSTPNLAIPVFDTLLGAEAAVLIAHSSFLSGAVHIDASTQLQAFEVLRRQRWGTDGYFNFDLLLGFKHGSLDDRLLINHTSRYSAAQGPILAGTHISRLDQFESENNFNGFLLGLERKHRWNGWLIGYTGKLSLGVNQSEVFINGQTATTVPNGGSSAFTGGVLAQSTNMGRFQQDEFMFLPEFEIAVKRQLNDSTRIHCGYSLMYWSSVARAGDSVNRRMSRFPPEPISGTADPSFNWNNSGFLAHGLQFGLDYKF